jgi:hypothetical protein
MAISNLSSGFRPGVCTSTTRPTEPYEGMMIYEADTNRSLTYNGSSWIDSNIVTRTHGVRVYHNGDQSIGSGSVVTLSFNSEDFDTDNYHNTSTNNSRLTVPSGLDGLYAASAYIRWDSNTTTNPLIAFAVNGVVRSRGIFDSCTFAGCFVSGFFNLSSGDYVEIKVLHGSGANRSVSYVPANTIIDPLSPQFEMYLINGVRA